MEYTLRIGKGTLESEDDYSIFNQAHTVRYML